MQTVKLLIIFLFLSGIFFSLAAETSPSPGQVKAKAEEILKSAEFNRHNEQQNLFANAWNMLLKIAIIKMILETLGTIIFDLINYIGVFIENAGIMDKLLIFMLFILLILLIWLMFRKRFKKEVSAQAAVELAKPATSEDRAREAAELAANKEYAAAIRRLYLSVLLNLHERNILDFVSTKTNWEYLGELQGNRALFQELEKLIEIFEHKFYGLEPASAEDWEEFSRISGGLKSAAR